MQLKFLSIIYNDNMNSSDIHDFFVIVQINLLGMILNAIKKQKKLLLKITVILMAIIKSIDSNLKLHVARVIAFHVQIELNNFLVIPNYNDDLLALSAKYFFINNEIPFHLFLKIKISEPDVEKKTRIGQNFNVLS